MSDFYEKPILNSPYEPPTHYWKMDERGQPTDFILEGRRKCELVTPVPKGKKQKQREGQKELKLEKDRYNPLPIINELRSVVESWRHLANPRDWGVSPETSRLLQHWRQKKEGLRPFFCQVEAVETAIWLAEVAPKNHMAIKHLQNANDEANPELFRIALKLATGAGKTRVMAMLIAWQTINAVRHPQSRNFTRGFLIVTPGITIKDRLRVLMPNDPENYYQYGDIVPREMLRDIQKAQIVITNYHSFIKRDILDLSKGTKETLQGHGEAIKDKENDGQMIRRVMPNLMGMKNIVVINDEAHHCYRKKPEEENEEELILEQKEEAKKNNKAASLWISGIETIKKNLGVRVVYDLSATPFFLSGSGYREGTLFPWTMSDFSLIDAIECGIVKLPRVPIISNDLEETPRYRELWQHIGKDMPKKGRSKMEGVLDPLKLPQTFNMALDALYSHYEKTFELWQKEDIKVPPVFIIVCNNTTSSKLVYDYISGFRRSSGEFQRSKFNLFSNHDEHGNRYPSPRTLLIDSEQLESDEALDKDFRDVSVEQIEIYRRELRARGEAAKAEKLSDKDLLREAMNTVGKEGRLGADIRCVVSVAMLSEGWDANTVTHILGVRAFSTQLLCEQVVGRALRRTSYDLDENGLFKAEYADIFGIPFDFTAKAQPSAPSPPVKRCHVRALEERGSLAIRFPRVTGYRVALPDEKITAKFTKEHHLEVRPDYAESYEVRNSGIIGEQVDMKPEMSKDLRPSKISYALTRHLLYHTYRGAGEEPKFNLFSQFQLIVREWLDNCVSFKGSTHIGQLCYQAIADDVCERIKSAIANATEDKSKIEVVLDSFNPRGSTDYVNFHTTRPTYETDRDKSHINFVTYDSDWEAELCRAIEKHPSVISYVKNQGLGFWVPYQMGGKEHKYYPDFIVKVDDGNPEPLHLVIEVKGYRKEDAKIKADTMSTYWIPGINQLGTFGRWAFAEFKDVWEFEKHLDRLIGGVKEK